MKIDYKALAEKLNALSERLVDSEEHAVEAAIPPIAEEAAEALCTLVSLLKGMADQEPIAWMYEHDGCMDTPIITIKRWAKCEEPWNESPLVPHPAPQPQPEPMSKPTDWQQIDRLLKTLRYLIGIAERGEGRKMSDDETAEQFVLGYVKRLESSEPTEAQIEAAAKYLCRKFVYRHNGYTFDSAWELFAGSFLQDGQNLLRAALAAKQPEPKRPGFLDEIDRAKEHVASWPQWMKDATISAAATLPVTKPKRKPLSEPTEAQSTIAERRLHHALDGLDHGIVANDVREVLDELAVLRATLATKETK